MNARLANQIRPGVLLHEFDLHSQTMLSRYIILEINVDWETIKVYCLMDTTRYFKQGSIVDLHFDEIESNDRYIWTVQ
jgi:hypothetical protein